MQDNNGAAAGDGISPTGTDASTTWQMLVRRAQSRHRPAIINGSIRRRSTIRKAASRAATSASASSTIPTASSWATSRPTRTLAERREYVDRIGDGVRDAGDLIQFSDDMLGAEINTNDWSNTRKSLLGQFTFHGNTVFVTANHFPAKGRFGQLLAVRPDARRMASPTIRAGRSATRSRRTSIRC